VEHNLARERQFDLFVSLEMRSRSIDGRQLRVSLWIAMLILIVMVFAPACSDDKSSKIHVKLEDLPQDKRLAPDKPAPASSPTTCPPAGVKPPEASAFHTRHKVFLKWKASKPSKDAANQVIGYCLYRSTRRGAAKENPRCPDCEQVNVFPIAGTACVDGLVKDGEKYYYVATAISGNRNLSVASNEIRVKIPRSKDPIGHPPPGFYPACRAEPAAKRSLLSR
jgi:hypothetical protein